MDRTVYNECGVVSVCPAYGYKQRHNLLYVYILTDVYQTNEH